MFDDEFSRYTGFAAYTRPRMSTQDLLAEVQRNWALQQAQAIGWNLAGLQQYRPRVEVPAWYEEWSKEMATEPLCNP